MGTRNRGHSSRAENTEQMENGRQAELKELQAARQLVFLMHFSPLPPPLYSFRHVLCNYHICPLILCSRNTNSARTTAKILNILRHTYHYRTSLFILYNSGMYIAHVTLSAVMLACRFE